MFCLSYRFPDDQLFYNGWISIRNLSVWISVKRTVEHCNLSKILWKCIKAVSLLSPFPLSPRGTSTEGEGEERGPEEVIDNIFTPEGTPHLVIPEDADRYGL